MRCQIESRARRRRRPCAGVSGARELTAAGHTRHGLGGPTGHGLAALVACKIHGERKSVPSDGSPRSCTPLQLQASDATLRSIMTSRRRREGRARPLWRAEHGQDAAYATYDSGRDPPPPPGLGTGRVRARKSLSCTPAVACVRRSPLDTCGVLRVSCDCRVLYSARTTDSSRLLLQFVRVIRDLASCFYCLVWTVVYGWPLFSVECGVSTVVYGLLKKTVGAFFGRQSLHKNPR